MDFRLKEVPAGDKGRAWTGYGLFYANGQVYFRTDPGKHYLDIDPGEVFDMEGKQVLLSNDTIVRPLRVVEPTPDPLSIDDLIVASKVIR